MKILLINNNPVVSRLTALSARKEDIEIDEIQEVTELSSDNYDIVFVDADSWSRDVNDVISENIDVKKSVLFYADGDEDEKESFDLSILKPFLPSEVSAVIRSIENEPVASSVKTEENHFNILDDEKETEREELFTLDNLDEVVAEKEESKKLDFDKKLEEAFPLKVNDLDDDLFDAEPKLDLDLDEDKPLKEVEAKEEVKVKKSDDELFDLDLSDELPELDDDLFSEDKKEKSVDAPSKTLDDEVAEVTKEVEEEPLFVLENDVEEKVPEVKQETKILDESEIENIKGILTEDVDNNMTLEDLMAPAATATAAAGAAFVAKEISETKEVKEEAEVIEKTKAVEEVDSIKLNEVATVDSGVLAQTLAAMPVQSLRELLAGATVKIEINFPETK